MSRANFGQKLAQFSIGGKTFFLNRQQTSAGQDFLAINAMYNKGGKPQYERLVVFQAHYLDFYKAVKGAIEQLAGVRLGEEAPQAEPAKGPECPDRCPNCYWHLLDPSKNGV